MGDQALEADIVSVFLFLLNALVQCGLDQVSSSFRHHLLIFLGLKLEHRHL